MLGCDREIGRIESFDISNIQGTDSVAGMVVLDRGKFDKKQYRVFNIKTVEGADDFRSMAEAVDRRYRRLLDEDKPLPDMILIDGGRGQLNAALAALNKLGIEEIPIAGLAKREEEIYVPDREEPIRLERRDPALQLLQMVRDETHRFSVSSHRRRRSKRTLHSALDDMPGHRREAPPSPHRALRQRLRRQAGLGAGPGERARTQGGADVVRRVACR